MRIFGKGKCKFIANFSATMVTSLPSLVTSSSVKGETGSVKGETICANFWQGKCKFIANFSAIMVTSLPSHYFRLTLSLSLSHRLYLTHNIGSAEALPILCVRYIR